MIAIEDTITPAMKRRIAMMGKGTEVLSVIGLIVTGYAKESFTDTAKRIAPWPNRIDGSPSTLSGDRDAAGKSVKRETSLKRSITFTAMRDTVWITSDRIYAAIHQFGGVIEPKNADALWIPGWGWVKKVTMPARPFIPVDVERNLLPTELSEDIQSGITGLLDWKG